MTLAVHDVGALADFGERSLSRVQVGRYSIVVVRWGDRVYALRDTCVHQGAPLSQGTLGHRITASSAGDPVEVDADSRILRCPWHGWQYDLCTGRSLTDPEQVRVRAFNIQVSDGRVLVDIG